MKVICRNVSGRKYLTDGKVYDVVSVEGDCSKVFPGQYVHEGAFEIVVDDGDYSYCLFKDCSHADWEIVE